MNVVTLQILRNPLNYYRVLCNVHRVLSKLPLPVSCHSHTITADAMDFFTTELLNRHRNNQRYNYEVNSFSIRNFMESEANKEKDIPSMTSEEIDQLALQYMSKNKDKQLERFVTDCLAVRKFISETVLKKLFRHYSIMGKPEMIVILQKYCMKVDPYLYKRNGEFLHYLAKAQCFKGNSDKGLSILRTSYKKYEGLRSFYRIIFRELIQDSVLNRSEASLVIFRKYVLEFSDAWGDHYPLVCFWHICWSSSWFSDQMLSNELLESSEALRDIIKDRATAFSITVLREEYNEDAVMRLLQALLKYGMLTEYAKVLQVLFNYKLRNKDIRGCTEIVRNCEVLGINLPSNQQGRYIKMLIDGKQPETSKPDKPTTKDFKLKF